MGRRGYGGGGRWRLYTYRYTVTTRMTSTSRWAEVRANLMFHNCEGQSHKTESTDHNFRREKRAETDSNRGPSAYLPNALPLGQTGSLNSVFLFLFLTIYVFGSYRSRFSVSYGHITMNFTATQMLIGRVLIDGAILFQFGDTGNSLRLSRVGVMQKKGTVFGVP